MRRGKPDIDNILKVVLDGLNGIAYEDDKQVTIVQCKKSYMKPGFDNAGLYVHVFSSLLFEELIAILVMVIHDHFGELMKKDGREERFAEMCLELYDTVEKGFVTPAELRQCLFEEAGVRFKQHGGSLPSERKEVPKG